MRVSCKSCGTEYVVSDARVAGRERTAHCGKCHTTFVIDGRGMCVPSTGGSGDERWIIRHYTQSELDTQELRDALASGSLPVRGTVVWRRGMADWSPVMTVEEVSRGLAAPPRSPVPGSPAPPTMSTLDMALSQTGSFPPEGRDWEKLEAELDGTRTPAPLDSPLSAAILSVSTPPEPSVALRREPLPGSSSRDDVTVPRLRGTSRVVQGPTLTQGAVAIARIDEGVHASSVSGARRIDLTRNDSWRAPVSERSTSASYRPGSLAPEGPLTPESVRPTAKNPSATVEAERGARAATRLSLMAAAGFLGCLALLHQFNDDSDARTPNSPPAVPPRVVPAAPMAAPPRAVVPANPETILPAPPTPGTTTAAPAKEGEPPASTSRELPKPGTADEPTKRPQTRTEAPPSGRTQGALEPQGSPRLQELVPFDGPVPEPKAPKPAESANPSGE